MGLPRERTCRETFPFHLPISEPCTLICQPHREWNFPSGAALSSRRGAGLSQGRRRRQTRTQPKTSDFWLLTGPRLLVKGTSLLAGQGYFWRQQCLCLTMLGPGMLNCCVPVLSSLKYPLPLGFLWGPL